MATPPKPTFEILNIADLCLMLGCSAATINRYLESGKLPKPFKLGKSRLWVRDDLILHLKAAAKAQTENNKAPARHPTD